MPRKRRADGGRDGIAGLVWAIVLTTIAVTPLVILPGIRDPFRVPKTLLFQASMLLTAGVGTAWLVLAHRAAAIERLNRNRIAIAIVCAALAWTAIVSAFAVQPAVAWWAPLNVFCHAVLVVATIAFARGTLLPLLTLFAPAALNSIVTILQALRLWSPFELVAIPEGRLFAMGMLGNPDYVGAYLIIPSIAAIAAAIAFRRALFGVVAVLLLAGIFFCQSVTAIGTIGVALFSFVVVVRSTKARIAIASSLLLILVGLFAYGPTRMRARELRDALVERRFNDFMSLRLPAFAVAVDMFQTRPLLGLGPGGFGAQYMSYKLEVDERHPEWLNAQSVNFGEAHNDHLQLLAETGLPGYLLFLGALVYVASISFRTSRPDEETAEFARLFGFPAAIGFGILALGQFPLYLVASTSSALFAAALACRWSSDESR